MKKRTYLFLLIAISVSNFHLSAQNSFEAFKKQQQAEKAQFEQDYYQDIAALDRLYREYVAQEKEFYACFQQLGYIPEKVKERVQNVEQLYPKKGQAILRTESAQALDLALRKWEGTKEEVEQEKVAVESLDIPDELIPLPDEDALQVADAVENIEIAVADNAPAHAEELALEREANRPVYCPLPENSYRVSSVFSQARKHPVLGVVRKHEGVDLAAPRGTKVYAAADGVVKISKYSRSAGKYVVVNHENGYTTSYMHLSRRFVSAGEKVKRGQLLGYVGTTGISTGNHLHYEIREQGNAYDPEPFFLAFFK